MNQVEQGVLRSDLDGIATLTLNRPRQFNALSIEVLHALQVELEDIARDADIRVVVLAAEGKAFCAGHDFKEMTQEPKEVFYQQLFDTCSKMMLTLNRMPQPVIAKVQGMATAAGCQLVAACDLAVAADKASFATSGIRYGLFCSTPAVPVSRNLGRKQAMELLLIGDFIDADTALQWGLINRVVKLEDLDMAVLEIAETIKAKSAVAVATGKKMFYEQLELPLSEAYTYASKVMACNMMAADAQEGFHAFLEKRKPVWTHS